MTNVGHLTRQYFDDFLDGLTWWLVGPEGRSRDFNASAYDALMNEILTAPLSEECWHRLVHVASEWNPSLRSLTFDERRALVQKALQATPAIVEAMAAAVSDVSESNRDFTRLNPERLAPLYRALTAVVAPQQLSLVPLLAHLVVPAAFPANDREIQPISDEGEFLNNVVATQRRLRLMKPGFVNKVAGALQVMASMSDVMNGEFPNNFPSAVKVAQLCALGEAHTGYFREHKEVEHGLDDFGRTMGDLAAFIAGLLNHESGEPVLDESTYQHYVKESMYRVDIRLNFRSAPDESDADLRHRLLAATPFLEGVLFWLYRCRAPRDFLLQTYQQSFMHVQTKQVLSDTHIAVVLRGLKKVAMLLSPDMNFEQLEQDLLECRGEVHSAYLQDVAPYVDAATFYASYSSPTDGQSFFDRIRALPSITNDVDASWVCHLVAPSAFAPLAHGGDHYLGVTGYQAYNARVKDMNVWANADTFDPYTAALYVLQYVSAGASFENLDSDAIHVWPLANLVVFFCLSGWSHPGIARQLAEEATAPLSGLLQDAKDFVSSTLPIESAFYGRNGWMNKGIGVMLDDIRELDGRLVVDRFVVPTELFAPGVRSLEMTTKREPKGSMYFPVRLVSAPGVAANFGKDTEGRSRGQ